MERKGERRRREGEVTWNAIVVGIRKGQFIIIRATTQGNKTIQRRNGRLRIRSNGIMQSALRSILTLKVHASKITNASSRIYNIIESIGRR